jgi:transcriptional regulator with XRE-family HTH domain
VTIMTDLAPAAAAPATVPTTVQPEPVPAASPDASRREELASFLRSRRERIRPEEAGLPPGGRRRTPGLRREEVAQLAGVGVTWYTWLEQGRDINVSAQVVDAIARTLRLDRFEWAHLSLLAGTSTAPAPDKCAAMSAPMLAMLRQLSPLPAIVLNDRYDVLAHNDAYNRAIIDLDALPREDRNVAWLVFTQGSICDVMQDPDTVRARLVAALRANSANHFGDRSWQTFIARLQAASPEFAELWERHDVAPMSKQTKYVDHPEVGLLCFQTDSLYTQSQGGVRLVIYAPGDDDTRERLERLIAG